MHQGSADARPDRARSETSQRYVIGHGIDTVVGGNELDRVIVRGRTGAATAFLVEDSAAYSRRTGSTAAAGQILVSVDGALIMSLSNIDEITISPADPGDSLTVAGDFSGTALAIDGLIFEGVGDRVDVTAVTSGHRVRSKNDPGSACGQGDDVRTEEDTASDADALLVFRTGPRGRAADRGDAEW